MLKASISLISAENVFRVRKRFSIAGKSRILGPQKIAIFRGAVESGAKKEPQTQKIARTAPKNYLNKSRALWEKLNQGVSKPGCFPLFSGKVQIVSRTLSGLFLVGAVNRLRKRKRTNRENPRTIPEQIRKIPEKSGKSQKGQKRTKKEGRVQIGKPPRLKPPRLAALEHYPIKQGFWCKSHQKIHTKVRRNLCRKSFWAYLFCPW